MNEGLIRVREFADECGCTPQNIYLHLKNYAAELEGHTHQGRRGILLDAYAQDFIRQAMYPKELSTDNSVQKLQEEVAELRGALFHANRQGMELAAKLAATEGERDRALIDAGQYQKLLAESTQEKEARERELADAHQQAQEEAEKADRLDKLLGKVQDERDAAEAREAAWKKYAADLEVYNAKKWWQRRKADRPVAPVMQED